MRLDQPLTFIGKPPSTSLKISFASRRYQSNISTSDKTNEYREDWAKVIEEYKKDKKRLAQNLGVAATKRAWTKAIRYQSRLSTSSSKVDYRQNWVKVIEEYKKNKERLAWDLGVDENGKRKRKIFRMPTRADVMEGIVSDIVTTALYLGASYLYYMLTGKGKKPTASRTSREKGSSEEQGESVDVWLHDPEIEEQLQGRDG